MSPSGEVVGSGADAPPAQPAPPPTPPMRSGGQGIADGTMAYTEQFARLRGHTPPTAPPPDFGRTAGRRDEHCTTRSELLAQRKQLYIDANEDRKRAHEEANPIWAATLSAPPGELKPSYNRTQSQMRAERRQDRVATSVLASGDGILDRDKNIMLASDPTALTTTISRPDAYGAELPLAFVDEPEHATRSALLGARKIDIVRANAQTMRRIGEHGYRSFYQRVGDRLDSSLKSYYDSQEAGGGKLTRGALMAQRKADFIAQNDEFLARHRAGEVRQPKYADQAEPFWTLGREVPQPAMNSRADLLESQQWYRRAEVYVPGRSPREPDPFKVGAAARLADKLSSGPKRFQRGYPAAKREVLDKVTSMDAPDPSALTQPSERKASIKETLRFLHFKVQSEQLSFGHVGPDMAMEAPMYSSFSRDGIFREPHRTPRPRTMMARTRPPERLDSNATLAFSEAARTSLSSPMLMSTRTPAMPGTAASVRSGGFQVIDSVLQQSC